MYSTFLKFDNQGHPLDYECLVSKETVVLRRRNQNKNLVLSNELIKVELPP